MEILFYKENIPHKLNMINLWGKEFKNSDDISLLPETSVGILYLDKVFSGMVFLLFPTDKFFEKESDESKTLKEQKVSVDDCYLYNFCITREEQKKGYGTQMLNKVEEFVKKEDKKRIVLFVDGDNRGAIKLYCKTGYKVQRATPNGFIMEKIL